MSNVSAYQAAEAYRKVSVTVSPLNAVVMLLDGAIAFLQRTIEANEARRIEESHNHMIRATAILRGLSHHLDFEKGGPLAERLYKTYSSLIVACLRSFGKPSANAQYRRIIASLIQLRDAWTTVAATNSSRASRPEKNSPAG